MSTAAIIMLIVAVVCVWGGLAAAVVNLRRSDAAGDEGPGRAPTGGRGAKGGRHAAG
ncbi:hypothetical protein GCM10027055_16000 [Janibacter alkaliphilus]|uniref:Methionine and alanine importer, small subunit n=1 Tax=Janibacter alkaliphilus TaxID=1069963 RepID=A0A852X3G2_9MICO|nr:methionine/alanine import family NSS transporter small subunit [Janibacter alkaliphilus]NYG37409.1 hypothetical protein [Janibacter alkaliphilus]